MSQSKVDKRRYEKKHRKEIMRKQKIKKVLAITATATVILAIVGSIAGVSIYKAIPKYVEADGLNEFIDETWKDSGYEGLLPATSSDAEESGDSSSDDESASGEVSDTEVDDASSEASE